MEAADANERIVLEVESYILPDRATAIRDGLRFADEHNIEIVNRKEFDA